MLRSGWKNNVRTHCWASACDVALWRLATKACCSDGCLFGWWGMPQADGTGVGPSCQRCSELFNWSGMFFIELATIGNFICIYYKIIFKMRFSKASTLIHYYFFIIFWYALKSLKFQANGGLFLRYLFGTRIFLKTYFFVPQ